MSLGRGTGRGRGVFPMYSSRCPGSHSRPHGESMALKHQCSHKSPVEDAEMSEEDVVEENPETRASCVCSRPKSMIICRSCGYTFVGRVRMHCPVHVGTILLMDVEACPTCKSFHLKELSEVLSPEKSLTRNA